MENGKAAFTMIWVQVWLSVQVIVNTSLHVF